MPEVLSYSVEDFFSCKKIYNLEIRRLAEFLRDDEDSFVKILSDKTNDDIQKQQNI